MELFKLFGSIFVNTDDAESSIQKTTKSAEGFASKLGNGIATAAKWGTAIVGGATAAGAGLTKFATSSASTADHIDKMSQKIGLSREAYQELDFICSQSGTEVDNLRAGMKTLTNQIGKAAEGTEEATTLFDRLGVSIRDSNGEVKSQETMLYECIDALQGVENQTEKAALANELFGKSGSDLMPLINGARGSISEMKEQAHELGLVMSDDLIDSGVRLTDSLDQTKRAFATMGTELGASLMPIVEQVSDYIQMSIPKIQELVNQLAPVITDLLNKLLPQLMSMAESLLPVIFELIEKLIPPITEIITAILPVIVELIEMLLPPTIQIIEAILPVMVELLNVLLPLIEPIVGILNPIIELVLLLIEPLLELINMVIPTLVEIISLVVEEINTNLGPAFESIISVLYDNLMPAFEYVFNEIIKPIVQNTFEFISKWWNETLKPVFDGICTFLEGVFSGNWEKAWEGIKGIGEGIWNGINNSINLLKDNFETVFNAIYDVVKDIFEKIWEKGVKPPINWIISGINSMVNGVINGINFMIDAMNSLSFDVPDWVPGIGGETFGFNIGKISNVEIPLLEKGGVLEKGQVGILEGNGAEAVVPLDRNREWISRVSDDMREQGIGGGDNEETLSLLREMVDMLKAMRESNESLPDALLDAMAELRLRVDNREFARLVKAVG